VLLAKNAQEAIVALTFIHTSDWHLGRTYERLGRRSAEMRSWRFEAVRRVYDLALEQEAAFILVAGDVFQAEMPRQAVVDDVVALLRDAPVPTILIPGNHDPLIEGTVWTRDEFVGELSGVANVKLALKSEPVEIAFAKTVIFPCPVTMKNCPEDITAWIPSAPRGRSQFRIGLAHGKWQEYNGVNYPTDFIAPDRANAAGLDYLALGDFHSYTPTVHPAAEARSYYSGTTECMAVDERGAGHALVVRIAEPGSQPQVDRHRVGRMRPVQIQDVLSPGGGFDRLKQMADAIEEPTDVLLGLNVSGVLTDEEYEDLVAWNNGLDDRFLGVDRQIVELYREPSQTDFDHLGLVESERRVLDLLHAPVASDGTAGQAVDGLLAGLAANNDVCREALALYYRELKQGATK
jgi:DNA repair exonuclease SbcCD nuclease subunit